MKSSSAKFHAFTSLDLQKVLEEMFLVLTGKEKEVVIKRFSLDCKPKQTLEKIGQHFAVTRERIRQIEKIALNKLKRTVQNTKLQMINEVADEILEENGGIMLESKLINEVLRAIKSDSEIDGHIIRLALSINEQMAKTEKSFTYKPFWHVETLHSDDIKGMIETGIKLLKDKKDVEKAEKLARDVQEKFAREGKNFETTTIISALEVDNRLKNTPEGFGLMSWRSINPRSIRDKAQIILKKTGKPLHFVEIANKISEAEFDRKVVTVQAVHNELIRYEDFVLVGRGLYALKEWGYTKGTVADVIEQLLKEKSPRGKQEIIDAVLERRQVKTGTISLNLQKNPHFVRVGRAIYTLDLSKKPR